MSEKSNQDSKASKSLFWLYFKYGHKELFPVFLALPYAATDIKHTL